MRHRTLSLSLMTLLFASLSVSIAWSAPQPLWKSKVLRGGASEKVEVNLQGAKSLYLVVTDAGDGYSFDWAAWVEPKLIAPGGKVTKLTELKWKSASSGWQGVHVGRSCEGGPIRVKSKTVTDGIGTHANSVIVYDLAGKQYQKFQALAAMDDGGHSRGPASIQFFVYSEKPDALAVAPAAARAGPVSQIGGSVHNPQNAVANLDVADGLEATLFASEPMIFSPTNLDVDARGRVWICEVMNYRHRNNTRKQGDRILILEDTDGDGRADKNTVYYQGRDVDSAMGICVLGNKVIVSATPNVFVFTDTDGDDKPDKKEVLFTGISGQQHDHSVHSLLFGPDGRLYFNYGNVGGQVKDPSGKQIVDLAGNEVASRGRPYRQGLAFRCNMDGGDFEVLGHNFRNNYEVTVDSFGTLWQSDNDDDGNRGVRINYVMEFGNFGYTDEITGAGWQTKRTDMHPEIPQRHWYQNSPGVVPNLLQTGAGSPTGICVYEGRLLPEVFHDQVIHCDAGPSVCRAYPVKKSGAGYSAEIVNVLHGARNNWFRPADVCVAPDGSLFVTDWYDPGVGGHRMGDVDRGRVFRVAPPKTPYKSAKVDLSTPSGAIAALVSPNDATRYLGWTALSKMQAQAEPALANVFADSDRPRHRARALHLLARIDGRTRHYVDRALADRDADLRITGLRIARQRGLDVIPLVARLVKDPSPQVRRECAIALRHHQSTEAPALWARLAERHDGQDRWYLEALGIGADKNEDAFFDAWLARVGDDWNTPGGRDLVWRCRAKAAVPLLAKIILDEKTTAAATPRYFRALDFHSPDSRTAPLLQLLASAARVGDEAKRNIVTAETSRRMGGAVRPDDPRVKNLLAGLLPKLKKSSPEEFVRLVGQLNLKDRGADLIEIALAHPGETVGADAAYHALQHGAKNDFVKLLAGKDVKAATDAATVLGNVGNRAGAAIILLDAVKNDKLLVDVRRQALAGLVLSRAGSTQILAMAENKTLPAELKIAAALELNNSRDRQIKQRAEKLLPLPRTKSAPLPTMDELVKTGGDSARGKALFTSKTCIKCHKVNGEGTEVGPDLSEIGNKLSPEAMYVSIIDPDSGISMGYENYVVVLAGGKVVTGLVISKSNETLAVKLATGIVQEIKISDVDEIVKQKTSLMPADLVKELTTQELADIVHYMQTLKQAAAAKPAE